MSGFDGGMRYDWKLQIGSFVGLFGYAKMSALACAGIARVSKRSFDGYEKLGGLSSLVGVGST